MTECKHCGEEKENHDYDTGLCPVMFNFFEKNEEQNTTEKELKEELSELIQIFNYLDGQISDISEKIQEKGIEIEELTKKLTDKK